MADDDLTTQLIEGMFGGTFTRNETSAGAPPGDDLERYAAAISRQESGGRYDIRGPVTRTGDRAYGRYQVMGNNVGPWTEAAGLGRMTPDEFLRNPQAQDTVFRHVFGDYLRREGPENAISRWFTGQPYAAGRTRSDAIPGVHRGLTGERYVRNVMSMVGGPRNVATNDELTGQVPPPEVIPPGEVSPPPPGPTGDVRTAGVAPPRTWSQYLAEPSNRAFLLQAGIQLMTPTWGGGMANLAAAIGAGGQAAAGTEQVEHERRFAERTLTSREEQAGLERTSRERTANIGAQARTDVANIRSGAMLERARLIGLRTPGQQTQFARLVSDALRTITPPAGFRTQAEEDAAYNRALEMAERAARRQFNLPGQPGAGGQPPGEVTTTAPPPGPGAEPPPGPGAGGPDVTRLPAGANSALRYLIPGYGLTEDATREVQRRGTTREQLTNPASDPILAMLSHPTMGQRFRQDLRTPEGVARIRATRANDAAFLAALDRYLQANPPGGASSIGEIGPAP